MSGDVTNGGGPGGGDRAGGDMVGGDARPPVVVIDAGVGNLGNLRRAFAHVGADATVTTDPDAVAAGHCLVLPGVGAFTPPREALRGALEEAIRAALDGGAWLLGICVGFQLLFESSQEFGETDGLGLLPGRVTRLPDTVPLPHIGWNRLEAASPRQSSDLRPGLRGCEESPVVASASSARPSQGAASRSAGSDEASPIHPLLAGLPEEAWVYFVHSFAPEGVPEDVVLARTLHGRAFPAVAGHGRVLGTQFHPEKSGRLGLSLLASYLRLAHDGLAHAGAGDEVPATGHRQEE